MDVLDNYPDEKELRALSFVPTGHGWATGVSGLTLKTHYPVGIDQMQDTRCKVQVFPNPCTNIAHLHLTLHSSPFTCVDLFSINGRKIRELVNREFMLGAHEIEIDVSDLPDGVYFVRLQTAGGTAVRKMIVSH